MSSHENHSTACPVELNFEDSFGDESVDNNNDSSRRSLKIDTTMRSSACSDIGEVGKDFCKSTRTEMLRQSSSRRFELNNEENEAEKADEIKLSPDNFALLKLIGKGAYGRVLQVREKRSGRIYAMKVLQKGHVIHTNNVRYVNDERKILSKADHPFVVKFMCAFQTANKLYLVMEYIAGGELFSRLRNEGLFSEPDAKFYFAEMVLAVEYLHMNGIIHRDMKPENVLLDRSGHIRITDFGLAKLYDDQTEAKTICGTDLYMAPEMLAGRGYGKAVDYWSLGAILYEMLTGDPPFMAKGSKKLYSLIMNKKPKFLSWMSQEVVDLMKGLLNRNVAQRLGTTESTMFRIGGVAELKKHAFFDTLDWNDLAHLRIAPPHIPKCEDNEDTSNFDNMFTLMSPRDHDEERAKFDDLVDHDNNEDFAGFSYTCPSYLEATMQSVAIGSANADLVMDDLPDDANDDDANYDDHDEGMLFDSEPVHDTSMFKPNVSPLRTATKSNTILPSSLDLGAPVDSEIASGRVLMPSHPPMANKETSNGTPAIAIPQRKNLNPNASEWVPPWARR